jgi:hypothetical protein
MSHKLNLPLSWRDDFGLEIRDAKNEVIATIKRDDSTSFELADQIVQAVNCREQLVEACQFALKYCEHQFKETGDAIPGDNCRTLRQALALAEGGGK